MRTAAFPAKFAAAAKSALMSPTDHAAKVLAALKVSDAG
jgi:hypothetical protein